MKQRSLLHLSSNIESQFMSLVRNLLTGNTGWDHMASSLGDECNIDISKMGIRNDESGQVHRGQIRTGKEEWRWRT